MASKLPDEPGETEEETHFKKRARRVSFAETERTVHFFNRDDDSEATPDTAKDDADGGNLRRTESEEIMELLQSYDEPDRGGGDGDDNSDDDSDVDAVLKTPFLRPFESPSSGSCIGSATPKNEDNLLGPVVADFIRPGRFLDSAASEENHDVTLDSTAFSMHFHSLARSDSEAEFKSPTAMHGQSGVRTPSRSSTAASPEDLMVLMKARKQVSLSTSPAHKVTDSGNSDDMSLVEENPYRYDNWGLAPELDVLLAEGSKDVGLTSPSSRVEEGFSISMSSTRKENTHALGHNGHGSFSLTHNGGDLSKTSGEAIILDSATIGKGNEFITDASAAADDGEIVHGHYNDVNGDSGPKTPLSNHIQASILVKNGLPLHKDEADSRASAEATGKFESPPSRTGPNLGHEQPLAGSISSLLAKRRQIFVNSSDSQNAHLNSALHDKEFYGKGSTRHAWSTSVFANSISRLKRLEVFRSVSASKVEPYASRLFTPHRSTISTGKVNKSENASKDISITHFDAPVVCLDAHFSNVAESDPQFRAGSNVFANSTEVKYVSHAEGVVKDADVSGLHRSLPTYQFSAKDAKFSSSIAYPERGPTNCKSNNHESELESERIENLHFLRRDYSLPETGKPGAFMKSPGNRGARKVSASPLDKESPISGDRDHRGESHSAKEKKGDGLATMPYLSSSDINHVVDVSKERPIVPNRYDHPVNSAFSETALMEKVSNTHKFVSSIDAVETGRILATSSTALSMQSPSLNSVASSNELPVKVLESPIEEPALSLLLKEPQDLKDDAKLLLSVRKDSAASPKHMSICDENVQIIHHSSSIVGSDGRSSLKRKLFDKSRDLNDESLPLHPKPKLLKGQKFCEEHQIVSQSFGSLSAKSDSSEVFTNFCETTKQLLLPMTDNFDAPLIEKLNEILLHLNQLKVLELHRDLASQGGSDSACSPRKRVADTKSILYKTLYRKVILQLLKLRRDKLLKRDCELKSKVEESEKLMSSTPSCIHGLKDVQMYCLQPESCSTDLDNRRLVADELSSLRKELKDSDVRITNLNLSIHSYVKESNELTRTKAVASVNELMNNRIASQSLQSEVQLCRVERLKAMHGQPNILFDHGGFFSQSYIVQSNSAAGLVISNTLNNAKISKNQMFLDFDVFSAFSFVLSGETHLTYRSLATITQELQKTNSLLHTLLDVVEEVELATFELRHLTWSRFSLSSDGKLDLQLRFIDFKSGAKVTVRIDVSCLKWGIYPSEVVPYDVQVRTARNFEYYKSLVASIETAVRGVKCGYRRIISICCCVSRMIQA